MEASTRGYKKGRTGYIAFLWVPLYFTVMALHIRFQTMIGWDIRTIFSILMVMTSRVSIVALRYSQAINPS